MTAAPAPLDPRLVRLLDGQEIRDLKARYAAAADAKYGPDRRRLDAEAIDRAARVQADCFTEDAIWEGGSFGGDRIGREALFAFFRDPPWRFTRHFYLTPRIDLDGDMAVAIWRLWELGIRPDGRVVAMTGETREEMRRTGDGWRIARMSFTDLHALVLADTAEAVVCLAPLGETL